MKRISEMKKELEKADLDGYLTMNIKNVYYFTGFMDISGATLALIIPADDTSILLTQPLSYAAASEHTGNCTVKDIGAKGRFSDRIISEVKELKIKKTCFDDVPTSTYLKLAKKRDGITLKHSPDIAMMIRRRKDKRELEYIRKAAMLANLGAEAGLEVAKSGVREYEIAAEIEYAMRAHGSEGVAFETVVASGPRSAYPHGLCSDRVVKQGDFITIDLGAVYSGYCSDITRTTVVGKPSPKQLRMLRAVMRAQEESFQLIHSGVKTRDVDSAARQVLKKKGLGKFFIHGLGHGVGLDIHEPPTLSPRSKEVLEEENVVTDEPGVYIQGFGGVRIEDTVLVHKDRGEKLTKVSYYEV